jgi:hypothetical protein
MFRDRCEGQLRDTLSKRAYNLYLHDVSTPATHDHEMRGKGHEPPSGLHGLMLVNVATACT